MPEIILNSQQKEAFQSIQTFLTRPAADTFVLKGYAGTGKTFLMRHLACWLKDTDQPFCMLASTGRAATVLRGKTGFFTKTVHSELYHFCQVTGIDDSLPADAPIDRYGQMSIQFRLRKPDEAKKIYIVDEASMLSSEMVGQPEFALFGSGALLKDFFAATGNNKIIFVGDPFQLPPVGQYFSPALDMDWLAAHQRMAISTTLEKIERTGSDNDILQLAAYIRGISDLSVTDKFPKLPARNLHHVRIESSQAKLFTAYVRQYKKSGYKHCLAIARSNKIAHHINKAVRRELFGTANPLQVDDVLLVTQNNLQVPLTNGDFIVIVSLAEKRTQAGLHFQQVIIRAAESECEYELLLSLDILNSRNVNFSPQQLKVLMVDFNRRMKKIGIAANSEAYKAAMLNDAYLNCLRVTYGYAVTCHKSQGGEWDDIFLFLEKSMYGMPRQELVKWWYTAVTRAKKQLHLSDDWWIV